MDQPAETVARDREKGGDSSLDSEGRCLKSIHTFREELVGKSGRSRPKNLKKPEIEETRPNEAWQYDVTCLCLLAGVFVNIVFILDRYSRKTVGARASNNRKSEGIIATWDAALESEGLLEPDDKPLAFSDRGQR